MGMPMSAAQAAQQDNRDGAGRYAEKAHTDPGAAVIGGLDFETADPNGLLGDAQRAHVTMLAGLMPVPGELRVERSCGGQLYVSVEADAAETPGIITKVSCLFWGGNEGIPNETWVTSAWKWPEKVGSYDSQAVTAHLVPSDSYDGPTIAANMVRLADMQDRLDRQLNWPAIRRDQTYRPPMVDGHVYHRFGATHLDLYVGDGHDTFTVEHGRVVKASIRTERYGHLHITDRDQLDTVLSEVGRTLAIQVEGIALPDWRQGRPERRVVEQFLFGNEE